MIDQKKKKIDSSLKSNQIWKEKITIICKNFLKKDMKRDLNFYNHKIAKEDKNNKHILSKSK